MDVCEEKFQSYKEREEHLIRHHTYPQDYFFAVTKFGINDKRQSMLVEHRKDHNSQRKEPKSGGRKSRGRAANPAADGGDTGESKDVQMTDAQSSVEEQQETETETAQDLSMVETPLVVNKVTATTKDAAVGDARNATVAGSAEKQRQHGPEVAEAEMEDLAGAMSSLKFVPRAIRLGPKQKPRR